MNIWTRWRRGRRIGTRVGKRVLLLFVAFGLAPALLTLTLTQVRVRETLLEQHYSRVGETVEALGLALWERLRMADEFAALLLQHTADGQAWDLGRTFDSAVLLSSSGAPRRLVTSGEEPLAPELLQATPPQGEAGRIVLAPGAPGAAQQVWLLRALAPRPAGTDLPSNWVALRISPEFLWIGIDQIPPSNGLCVFDADNRPLHCTEALPPDAQRALARLRLEGMAGRVLWDTRGTRDGQPIDEGDEHSQVSVYREVFLKGRFKTGSWNVVLTQPAQLALSAERKLRQVIWPAAFVALIGALLLAIGQVRRTLVPLQALTGATQRLAARDFSSRVKVSADNEFAVLGEAFNDMADGLSHQFDTLEALAAIDRVILEGQSLHTVGGVALDLMARRLSTPVFGLALGDGAGAGAGAGGGAAGLGGFGALGAGGRGAGTGAGAGSGGGGGTVRVFIATARGAGASPGLKDSEASCSASACASSTTAVSAASGRRPGEPGAALMAPCSPGRRRAGWPSRAGGPPRRRPSRHRRWRRIRGRRPP